MDIPKIIIAVVALIIISISVYLKLSRSSKKNSTWVNTEDFQNWKNRLSRYTKEDEFEQFFSFLQEYDGGYIKRSGGKIVRQEYLNKEKGDLKGIFYNLVIPNPNIDVALKEKYRRFMISAGVNGVDARPDYETRDSRLRNNEKDKDDFERKEVGNKGESIVRDVLARLDKNDYSVINGPLLKVNDTVKEFDHIVVGRKGVFCIETKAFGMSEGKASKGVLAIESEDRWILHKGNYRKELESPTLQMKAEKELLDVIVEEFMVDVMPVLVLSNTGLTIKMHSDMPYAVVKVDELEGYILSNTDTVYDNDRMFILKAINDMRVN